MRAELRQALLQLVAVLGEAGIHRSGDGDYGRQIVTCYRSADGLHPRAPGMSQVFDRQVHVVEKKNGDASDLSGLLPGLGDGRLRRWRLPRGEGATPFHRE